MESENNNLKLWKKVEKTNPNYTKKSNIGGHKITAIAPQYQIMQVTEQFGVYGEKWGFKDIELDYSLASNYDMVVFKGTFFFPKGEFEIINSCKLFMDNAKKKIDDNFAKKIETDTLTKAISKLGFNADIFLGKFDDVRYLEEVTEEFKTPEQKQSDIKANENEMLRKQKLLKDAEERKKALTITQYDAVVLSKNLTHISHFLENFRMSDTQRKDLTKILENGSK